MKILHIYPFNNPVSNIKTKPVVSAGITYVKLSRYIKDITVISRDSESYISGLSLKTFINCNNRKQYHRSIINFIAQNIDTIKLVEIHQDTKLAAIISKKFTDRLLVCLIKHGQYLINRWREKFILCRWLYQATFLKYIDYVMCISKYVQNNLISYYPYHKEKFKLMYNTYGHIIDHIHKPLSIKFEDRKNNIVFAGKPVKNKGIYTFIAAIKKLIKIEKRFTAVIVGGIFSNTSKIKYTSDLNKLINNNEVKEHISNQKIVILQSLGLSQLYSLLQNSKVVVVPSVQQEAFGLIALEAHLAGCIVVSSGSGGLKEISGHYAYYFDGTKIGLYTTLLKVINELDYGKEMANNGKVFVLDKFNCNRLVAQYDDWRSQLIEL